MKIYSEEDCIKYLIRGVGKLKIAHEAGQTYCDKLTEWEAQAYGWHNQHFPPEYKKCCLNGETFIAEPTCDLYYFMITVYERITGKSPPVNFQLNKMWKKQLLDYTKEWNLVNQKSVIHLFAVCTRLQPENRIKNAVELMKTEDFQVLIINK